MHIVYNDLENMHESGRKLSVLVPKRAHKKKIPENLQKYFWKSGNMYTLC